MPALPPAAKLSRRLAAARRSGLIAALPARMPRPRPCLTYRRPDRLWSRRPPATQTARRTSGETASGAGGADACSGEAHADGANARDRETGADRGAGAQLCGPPAIRPFAMPGPKIDNPSSVRDAGISVSASEMVGGSLKPEVK